MMPVSAVNILKNPIHCLAFGLGAGLSPKAPGTAGTALAVVFYIPLSHCSLLVYGTLLVLAFVLGVYLCGKTAHDLGVHDHPGIVWDEFVGYWITMFSVPIGWGWMLLGFVLFRLFDIWKPWPIALLDKKVAGGFGIMIDDVLAGIYALIVLKLIIYFI